MGIFSDNDKTDSSGCPVVNGENTIYKHGSAHHTLYIISGICAAITLVSALALQFQHLRRYRQPKEQRQIVKIILTPFAFAVIGWASVSNYHVAPYISLLGEWYSSWCVAGIFLLFIQFAVPEAEFGEDMFHAMGAAVEQRHPKDKANWPKLSWLLVFQYPITDLIAMIVLDGTEASNKYCASSLKPKFGHFWTTIIKTVGVVLAVVNVLRFYKRMKSAMKPHRAIGKLVCFKGIVFLTFIQNWVITILIDRSVIKPSSKFSYGDLFYGIPGVLVAAEMCVFSAGFWWAFSSSEYSSKARPQKRPMNFFLAILDAANPSDLILGILRIPMMLSANSQAYAPSPGYGGLNSRQQYRQPQYARMDASLEDGTYGMHDRNLYNAPPPTYPAEGDPKRTHLLADGRKVRSTSRRR